jgi:hypothetical protein
LSSVARDDAALAEINNPQRWEREEEEEGVRVGVGGCLRRAALVSR